MYKALIIDNDVAHADRVAELLEYRGFAIERVTSVEAGCNKLRGSKDNYALVVVTEFDGGIEWSGVLKRLQSALQITGFLRPLVLCIGRTKVPAETILWVERLGGRYVYEQ